MAASDKEVQTVPSLWEDLWKSYEYLDTTDESTVSDKFQDHVKKMIENAEKAIHMVNQLSLFSSNEEIEEISTNQLRYMLLPALLGYASLKNTRLERIDVVKKARVSYKEYLRLVKLYKLTNVEIPGSENEGDVPPAQSVERNNPQAQLISQAQRRKDKIERFRQQKQEEAKLKELHKAVNREHVDEEVKREYYLTLLKRWVSLSVEELESIADEIPILEHMSKMKLKGQKEQSDEPREPHRKPMAPFILTRDRLQAQVIGAGYPSLPTYTLEEFYEQKYKDAQPAVNSSDNAHHSPSETESEVATNSQEADDIEKERKVETDDPESLRKAREFDEYKDDHRRGWGNRQNRS